MMIMAPKAPGKVKQTVRWIRHLVGWMLLILFFMGIGWFFMYVMGRSIE